MISDNPTTVLARWYRLEAVQRPGRRGAPKKPERFARNLLAATAYEARGEMSSAEAFEAIAEAIRMSPETVAAAVTHYRKARAANK